MIKTDIGIAILGGSGYTSSELLRLLAIHEHARVTCITSRSLVGQPVTVAHPHLTGIYDLCFSERIDWNSLSAYQKVIVFAALPHGVSSTSIAALVPELPAHAKLIDFSGDLRIQDPVLHHTAYPNVGLYPELREQFVYGLPEFHREQIAAARYVANPGCFATACNLAGAVLADKELRAPLFFDAKSGTSGAGREPSPFVHHPSQNANLRAYKVMSHRHEHEICQELGRLRGRPPEVRFVPHLLPTSRGIFVSVYAELCSSTDAARIPAELETRYTNDYFVRVFPPSQHSQHPDLNAVIGSNFCDISCTVRGSSVVVFSALDNLIKGAAGQAIQNMNLMCGLEESTGLKSPGLGPH